MTEKQNQGSTEVPIVNIANAFTMLRVVLIPVFIWAYWEPTPGRAFAAWAIFVIAAATDKLDGHLARSRGLITNFGKLADSIADKGLIAAALIMLSWHGRLWWWVTILLIARELYITIVRMTVVKKKVMAAGTLGKYKMVAQSVGAGWLIVPWDSWFAATPMLAQACMWVGWIILGVALVLSIWSAIGYTRDAVAIAHEGNPNEN
ncbi:CDP-diacylglycerol--glycerol-3-phosphate 3-phosphatidyltransferase [Actinobaculum suis]|uniref:CDP-diacylglycerol--glycerol-3-phosphate 3-phosphatidyltransferase n=1 Tax=Actinobaculum suis TaxID=1657 RepID=UPI00066FF542|nr:CDP-diacylglycerol--glycerol-3-phosphate 3-phosphatidyltransferase [Actinobaculum suis]KMY24011.1 CDP-diacylglycerol--glycerol-3-phosphate 3-phosphatidyltransferase [Actinobaculum suis]